jgi:hypothetical protein
LEDLDLLGLGELELAELLWLVGGYDTFVKKIGI